MSICSRAKESNRKQQEKFYCLIELHTWTQINLNLFFLKPGNTTSRMKKQNAKNKKEEFEQVKRKGIKCKLTWLGAQIHISILKFVTAKDKPAYFQIATHL